MNNSFFIAVKVNFVVANVIATLLRVLFMQLDAVKGFVFMIMWSYLIVVFWRRLWRFVMQNTLVQSFFFSFICPFLNNLFCFCSPRMACFLALRSHLTARCELTAAASKCKCQTWTPLETVYLLYWWTNSSHLSMKQLLITVQLHIKTGRYISKSFNSWNPPVCVDAPNFKLYNKFKFIKAVFV